MSSPCPSNIYCSMVEYSIRQKLDMKCEGGQLQKKAKEEEKVVLVELVLIAQGSKDKDLSSGVACNGRRQFNKLGEDLQK